MNELYAESLLSEIMDRDGFTGCVRVLDSGQAVIILLGEDHDFWLWDPDDYQKFLAIRQLETEQAERAAENAKKYAAKKLRQKRDSVRREQKEQVMA